MAGLKFVVFILVLMDQLFKLWAYNVTAMTDFNIIPGVFRISYVENYGAAFNLFTGSRWLLIGVTGVLLLIIGYLIFGKKITDETLLSGLSMILAGGLSNLIDRILRGYVVDCLDFTQLINFLIMAFVVFLVIRQLNKLYKKPAPPAKPTEKECPYCKTKIAIAATRCPHCTSILSDEIQSEAAAALKE